MVTIDPSGKILKRVDKRPMPPANPSIARWSCRCRRIRYPSAKVGIYRIDVTISLEEGETKIIKTRQHYTLEKVANGMATISIDTQVLTPVNNPKIQSQLVQHLKQGTFDSTSTRAAWWPSNWNSMNAFSASNGR